MLYMFKYMYIYTSNFVQKIILRIKKVFEIAIIFLDKILND